MESLQDPGGTEDDTFERLRRMSQSELENRYEWMCREITSYEQSTVRDEMMNARDTKNGKLISKLTLGFVSMEDIHIHTTSPAQSNMFKELAEQQWKATGWTYESYARPIRERCRVEWKAAVKTELWNMFFGILKFIIIATTVCIFNLLVGMSTWFAVPLAVLIAFGGDYIVQIFTSRSFYE